MKRSGDFWPLYGRKRRPQPAPPPDPAPFAQRITFADADAPAIVARINGHPYTAAMLERRAARLAEWPVHRELEGDDQIVYTGEGQGQ